MKHVDAGGDANGGKAVDAGPPDEEEWDAAPDPASLTHPPARDQAQDRTLRKHAQAIENIQADILQQLREYIMDFADPDATEDLNDLLDQRSYRDLYGYYVDRPELAEYTLQSEFERLSVSLL